MSEPLPFHSRNIGRLCAAAAFAVLQSQYPTYAEPVRYFFAGQITEKRSIFSIFNGSVGDQYSGYFSYDTTAPDQLPNVSGTGWYSLLEFSVDGVSLNVGTGTAIPYIPGIAIDSSVSSPLGDFVEIRGFNLASAAFNYDNGSTSLWLVDRSGTALSSDHLPPSIDFAAFGEATFLGPIFGPPLPTFSDRGTVTDFYVVPEPGIELLLALGVAAMITVRMRYVA